MSYIGVLKYSECRQNHIFILGNAPKKRQAWISVRYLTLGEKASGSVLDLKGWGSLSLLGNLRASR